MRQYGNAFRMSTVLIASYCGMGKRDLCDKRFIDSVTCMRPTKYRWLVILPVLVKNTLSNVLMNFLFTFNGNTDLK